MYCNVQEKDCEDPDCRKCLSFQNVYMKRFRNDVKTWRG